MTETSIVKHKDLSERTLGILLLLPAALLLLVIVVYPIATLFWNSLHSADPNNPQAEELFVGLDNYTRMSSLPCRARCSSGSGSLCSPINPSG